MEGAGIVVRDIARCMRAGGEGINYLCALSDGVRNRVLRWRWDTVNMFQRHVAELAHTSGSTVKILECPGWFL
jgi:hypothetical protein